MFNTSVLEKNSDLCIKVPSRVTSHIQELHIIVVHLLCTLIEKQFFEKNLTDENFIPNPEKSDKSFFEKVKDMFS